MHQYKRPARPSKPKTPKLIYIALAVVLMISVGFIVNYVYSDFMFIHGAGPSMASAPEPYIPTPITTPTPAQAATLATPVPIVSAPEPTPDPEPTPPPRVQRQEFLDYRTHFGNDGIVGRIWIPNTSINYIVPQTTDNFFYLEHDIRGDRYAPGWVWLCAYADIHAQEQNLVVFGHNMGSNEKFHALRHFLDRDFFFNNRYIYFSTIYADYVFEVFSVYITHTSWPYIQNNFSHWPGGWAHYISEFARMSLFDAGIAVSENDRVITLSTCYNAHIDYRIAVHGRLISETFPHLQDEHYISLLTE